MQTKAYKEETTGFRGACKICRPTYRTQHMVKVQAIKRLYWHCCCCRWRSTLIFCRPPPGSSPQITETNSKQMFSSIKCETVLEKPNVSIFKIFTIYCIVNWIEIFFQYFLEPNLTCFLCENIKDIILVCYQFSSTVRIAFVPLTFL